MRAIDTPRRTVHADPVDVDAILLDELAGDGRRSTADRSAVAATLFSIPALAAVWLTERAARGRPRNPRRAPAAGGDLGHAVTASELRDAVSMHPSSTEALTEVLGALAPPETAAREQPARMVTGAADGG